MPQVLGAATETSTPGRSAWTPSVTTRSSGWKAGRDPDFNHAKVGVSTGGSNRFAIFDMNQQASLSGPNCGGSQTGRGGLFFVLENGKLADSVQQLIQGEPAPVG